MLLAEVANYLVAQGVAPAGSTGNYVVCQGYMPPSPDKIIALYETGGFPNEGLASSGSGLIDRPTFQVRVRGAPWGTSQAGYTTARAKLESVRATLEGVMNKSIGSPLWRYVHIRSLAPSLDLGRDVNDRPNLAMNFGALRSRTS